MIRRGVSISRRSRQLYRNQKLFSSWWRAFPLVRFENELSSVVNGVKHKALGQQGALKKTFAFNATQQLQYLHYLYPFVSAQFLTNNSPATFEARLDVVSYHLDWSCTKSSSRQDVSHGHFRVNGVTVTVPSYRLCVGDIIQCQKDFAHRFGFTKPYYSSFEVNHRILAAIFLNPNLPCQTSVCNVKSKVV